METNDTTTELNLIRNSLDKIKKCSNSNADILYTIYLKFESILNSFDSPKYSKIRDSISGEKKNIETVIFQKVNARTTILYNNAFIILRTAINQTIDN